MYGGPPPAWNGGPPAPYGGPPAGNGVMLYGAPQYGAAPPYPEAVPYAPGPAYGAAAGPPAYCAPFAGVMPQGINVRASLRLRDHHVCWGSLALFDRFFHAVCVVVTGAEGLSLAHHQRCGPPLKQHMSI